MKNAKPQAVNVSYMSTNDSVNVFTNIQKLQFSLMLELLQICL